ncbi:hypothetical protein WA1_21320 [Scytonema hofmannii PCC 7110]|uniref:DUF4058 domain-containing protein n=1 Tax=Scytonema hofmannii PCC 7110 TaxID=128403 RepID=A0A139XCT2_9CYAN|nr:DUF4058 family protein [Scytonema hofmannii]KYC42504.1 hypothetical protein WA1_21320 [Scytonema hofmannii PCC 7110]
MPSPFPGMNPYLEDSEMWPEVHHWVITVIAELLVPQLRPKYRVAIEKRVYQTTSEDSVLIGIPDISVGRNLSSVKERSNLAVASPPATPVTVGIPMLEEVEEGFLEVREVGTGEVVTAIELLSPKNKRSGEGRRAYESKRQKIFSSLTHLVEIDLLRGGKPMAILNSGIQASYRILVSRSDRRPLADLYPFELQQSIPVFPLPLREGDTEPLVDLQALLHGVYDRAGLDMAIDYTSEAVPPLSEADAKWANELLKQQGLR